MFKTVRNLLKKKLKLEILIKIAYLLTYEQH